MDDNKRSDAVTKFFSDWSKHGSEKSDAQLFWIELLQALGLENINRNVEFEKKIEHLGYIDVFIKPTGVLVEQKSRGIDLDKPARQSDGSFLTPFEQAKRYADALPYSQHPRWIVVCNFDEFRIYDMDRVTSSNVVKFQSIKFAHLPHAYIRLGFLVDPNDDNIEEVQLSKDAVNIMKRIRQAFARKMLAPRKFKPDVDPVEFLSSDRKNILNKFCVRLVFCLYSEDAAVFNHNQFVDYIKNAADYGSALVDLFTVLNTPADRRDPTLRAELKNFPYVNGGLFDGDALNLPPFDNVTSAGITLQARTPERNKTLSWFTINPTIFGALFESDLNRSTRRTGGMHYTSRDNIHKLIKPLFLDELHDEFDAAKRKSKQNRRRALENLQDKIASLTFLDPACGSGNFLTETYIKLRELENDILRELLKLGAVCEIKVSIDQFFGIEINDFACAIAQTAMWISEHKMLFDTEIGIRERVSFLPLKHSARIVCGNALTLDWKKIVPDGVDYIIGNPPFVGYSHQSPEQKAELLAATALNNKKLDYVTAWFYKAADFMDGNYTRAAFVATNSIVQGEQVAAVWRKLFETVHIDFAYRTFKWTSESENMAAVHCVIVGFSVAPSDRPRIIFDGDQKIIATNINAYLFDGPNYFVEKRTAPLCDVPPIMNGNRPADGGNLIIEADDYDLFVRQEPRAEKFIRRLLGSEEFINGKTRWCLWLVDATAEDLRLPLIADRVERCRLSRLKSTKAATRKLAATPHLFQEIRQPKNNFILVPTVSSERRQYIPMDFLTADVITTNTVQIIPDADLFHFGVLTSSVHMAWMRTVGGRLEMRYSYSNTLVYNNFVWCSRSAAIEDSARHILEARALYPARSLASLYNPESMPEDLRAAHEANDLAVLDAYGFARDISEAEIVSRLMEMYQRLTAAPPTDKIAIK